MFPLDWQSNSIVEGEFTVESDRAAVVQLGEMAVRSKLQHLQDYGPLHHYRFYLALRPKLLRQDLIERQPEQFLSDFRFQSLSEAAQDTSSMSGVMCAIFSGDNDMLHMLAQCRADMNQLMHGLGNLGYYDTQTTLMAATKSHQDPSVLITLIELRADANGRARTGLPAVYMSRTPGHVKALLENRAEIVHGALNGTASFAGPETVQELLKFRCDPALVGGTRYGPLHAVALFSRSNRRAVETARLLLEHHADVNVVSRPSGSYLRECWQARLKISVAKHALACPCVIKVCTQRSCLCFQFQYLRFWDSRNAT